MNAKQLFILGLSVSLALTFTSISYAGEKEDELIAKVTQAYGGDALLGLRNYQVAEHYLSPTTGQSHSPQLTEIGESTQILTVDLENKKSVYDTWFAGRGGNFQGSTVSDGEKGYTLNYQTNTYGDAGNADVMVFAGGSMRTSDVILVHHLNQVSKDAVLGEDETYMSRLHHTISVPFPSSPDLKLYIDAETLLVSKMQRINPQLGALDYVYSDHTKQNGISYAASTNFFVAGVPNLISTQHDVSFNLDLAEGSFDIPEGFSREAERIDTTNMLSNKLADGVYHIGQGNAYSIFVDTNIGIVSAGGYPGIGNRFERFREESENYKPLVYQVVTHHHSDHIGGLAEATALGARLVTVEENVDAITQGVNPSPKRHNFFTMKSRMTLGDGRNRVEIYEVSTIHAKSFLVTYVPQAKTIFIADHMGSPFASGTPVANQGTVDMLTALDALDIDVKKIVTSHNARVFTIKDMRDSVAAFKPTVCAGNRPICR